MKWSWSNLASHEHLEELVVQVGARRRRSGGARQRLLVGAVVIIIVQGRIHVSIGNRLYQKIYLDTLMG